MRPLQVVVVDDEPNVTAYFQRAFTALGQGCAVFSGSSECKAFLRGHPADLALLDIYLGEESGIDVARQLRLTFPELYVAVMTAHVSLETAAGSAAEGAVEYLAKPITTRQLADLCARVDAHRRHSASQAAALPEAASETAMIGRSAKMVEVYNAISRAAPSNANVLILGASGTGKELVARALHRYSKRSTQAFVPVNCGSFTETLLESELFGHEKGAFTGAQAMHKGLLESAAGGTVFLDEVTETAPAFQVKLLRVLQEQQIRRVGSSQLIPIDVRILAASNRNVKQMIRDGIFREDLYYRLSVVQIELPALRERREDIPLLIENIVRRFRETNGRPVSVQAMAVERLQGMDWPGNIRELENMVNRLAIFSPTGLITLRDVEREASRTREAVEESVPVPPPDRLIELERQQITRVLKASAGNKAEAARRLGIERKTLYKKALRLGISLQAPDEP
jgi:DNA-binding NtrC family response regulator